MRSIGSTNNYLELPVWLSPRDEKAAKKNDHSIRPLKWVAISVSKRSNTNCSSRDGATGGIITAGGYCRRGWGLQGCRFPQGQRGVGGSGAGQELHLSNTHLVLHRVFKMYVQTNKFSVQVTLITLFPCLLLYVSSETTFFIHPNNPIHVIIHL